MEEKRENNNSLSKINVPLVIKPECLSSWPCMQWTIADWAQKSGVAKLKFRVHKKNSSCIWENEAVIHFETYLSDFVEYLQRDSFNCDALNPFKDYPKDQYWIYSSYNYMSQIYSIENHREIIDSIKWSETALDHKLEKNGINSSLWIGTKSAFTPCHYDTYGYNLVAQLTGKKLWILFPPSDSKFMYPTRIPFEESSVFSSVNIRRPNLKKYPLFQQTRPHLVELKAGEILLVPQYWWHYVEVVGEAEDGGCISVNNWLSDDNYENSMSCLRESIVRLLTTSLFETYQPIDNSDDWLNTGTDLFSANEAIDLVTVMVSKCASCSVSQHASNFNNLILPENSRAINDCTYKDILKYFCDESEELVDINETEVKNIINAKSIISCILLPDVIELIAEKLKKLSLI